MKLIIKRSEWYRGRPTGSMLLRPKGGQKCCLGFLALACGIPQEAIAGFGTPKTVSKYVDATKNKKVWHKLFDIEGSTHVCNQLIFKNDCPRYESEDERETQIASVMKKIGVDVTYED